MFVVTKYYPYGGTYNYYCRTIEKAKEIFERIFWEWVEQDSSDPEDLDCSSWEEILCESWETGEWDEVVSIMPIHFEEDEE